MGGESVLITTLDWIIEVLFPTVFNKLDNWLLVSGVSVLGVMAACMVVWFVYRRFLE